MGCILVGGVVARLMNVSMGEKVRRPMTGIRGE